MPAIEESFEPPETISAGEAKFEAYRKRAGYFLAPAVFLAIFFFPFHDLKPEAHRLAAIMAAVIVLWLCETLPMTATALLGAAAAVVFQVADAKTVFAPFADPLIFLFIGSFILARALFVRHLDKRVAFTVLSWKVIGGRPSRILFAFGAVTAFMSGWMSNTATTAMMFAIGLSIISFLKRQEKETGIKINPSYATALMLMTSFSASIGGVATPIGTPPNVIGIGFIRSLGGTDISFFNWMQIGVPVVVILFLFLWFYLNKLAPAGVKVISGSSEMLAAERDKLGPWTRGQRSVAIAFGVTVILWIVPGIIALVMGEQSAQYKVLNSRLPESVGALIGAMLLFVLSGDETGEKAISWADAVKIDWGVIFLYGGGFALGVLSFQTGLAEAVGRGLTEILPFSGGFGLLVASVLVAVIVSETTSNTASANMVVPVVIAIAQSQNADPFIPALGATLAASLGFMLPVSTPCNAIVYGSGYIPLMKMVRYGILLDIVGSIVIIATVWTLGGYLR
ncbi:MAG: DASS family sodium-coupled anion symporter [Acidobacteria bacterium]|nr:DASS family sodium-coupled anion symporter [Acidobacteriota bacterium]